MIKKAILLKEINYHVISFLATGYWLGENTLTYYNDEGKQALGDLIGRVILLKDCKPLILEEFYQGMYNVDFTHVDIVQSDFNRKYDTSALKNWVGWTTKHKKFELVEKENYNWVKVFLG